MPPRHVGSSSGEEMLQDARGRLQDGRIRAITTGSDATKEDEQQVTAMPTNDDANNLLYAIFRDYYINKYIQSIAKDKPEPSSEGARLRDKISSNEAEQFLDGQFEGTPKGAEIKLKFDSISVNIRQKISEALQGYSDNSFYSMDLKKAIAKEGIQDLKSKRYTINDQPYRFLLPRFVADTTNEVEVKQSINSSILDSEKSADDTLQFIESKYGLDKIEDFIKGYITFIQTGEHNLSFEVLKLLQGTGLNYALDPQKDILEKDILELQGVLNLTELHTKKPTQLDQSKNNIYIDPNKNHYERLELMTPQAASKLNSTPAAVEPIELAPAQQPAVVPPKPTTTLEVTGKLSPNKYFIDGANHYALDEKNQNTLTALQDSTSPNTETKTLTFTTMKAFKLELEQENLQTLEAAWKESSSQIIWSKPPADDPLAKTSIIGTSEQIQELLIQPQASANQEIFRVLTAAKESALDHEKASQAKKSFKVNVTPTPGAGGAKPSLSVSPADSTDVNKKLTLKWLAAALPIDAKKIFIRQMKGDNQISYTKDDKKTFEKEVTLAIQAGLTVLPDHGANKQWQNEIIKQCKQKLDEAKSADPTYVTSPNANRARSPFFNALFGSQGHSSQVPLPKRLFGSSRSP